MKKRESKLLISAVAVLLLAVIGASYVDAMGWGRSKPRSKEAPREITLEVTGYCKCGSCCGWKRNWYGRPVVASGPSRGKPKRVGITASGSRARRGTIAADKARFPFGTVMYVPGYGYGVVEDRGGGIKGGHIDVYFRSHREAMKWGRQRLKVKVWEAME